MLTFLKPAPSFGDPKTRKGRKAENQSKSKNQKKTTSKHRQTAQRTAAQQKSSEQQSEADKKRKSREAKKLTSTSTNKQKTTSKQQQKVEPEDTVTHADCKNSKKSLIKGRLPVSFQQVSVVLEEQRVWVGCSDDLQIFAKLCVVEVRVPHLDPLHRGWPWHHHCWSCLDVWLRGLPSKATLGPSRTCHKSKNMKKASESSKHSHFNKF